MRLRPASPADAETPPSSEASPAGKRQRWMLRLVLACVAIALALALGEVGLRLFFKERLQIVEDERYLLYRYHKTLGWFPIPSTSQRLKASRIFSASRSHSGVEPWMSVNKKVTVPVGRGIFPSPPGRG